MCRGCHLGEREGSGKGERYGNGSLRCGVQAKRNWVKKNRSEVKNEPPCVRGRGERTVIKTHLSTIKNKKGGKTHDWSGQGIKVLYRGGLIKKKTTKSVKLKKRSWFVSGVAK